MVIYRKDGYLDMKKIKEIDVPFIFVVGARGIGKTYGAITTQLEDKEKFMLLRRTQLQCDMITKPETSPLKSPLWDKGYDFKVTSISKQTSACYLMQGDKVHNTPFCYTGALSTFSNLRGFDGSDIPTLIYDEFIPQKQERPIKEESEAFFNCYETMNRNRELKGQKPLKALLLANSFDIANSLFISLNLVLRAQKMIDKGIETHIDYNRGLALIIPQRSPISEQKRKTALYRLTGTDTEFGRMALSNEFSGDVADNVLPRKLKEFRPVVTIGEITIYKHKSDGTYYVSSHENGSPKETFTMTENDRKRFTLKYHYLWSAFLANRLFFENYLCQILFDKSFKT